MPELYGDEYIIKERVRAVAERQLDIRQGVEMQGGHLAFERVELGAIGITIMLPECFEIMPDELVRAKYIAETKPQVVLSADRFQHMVNFTFTNTHNPVNEGQVPDSIMSVKAALKKLNPANYFMGIGQLTCGDGLKVSTLEYIGYAIDGKVYNMAYGFALQDELIYATFSCPEADSDSWSKPLEQMICSIEVVTL